MLRREIVEVPIFDLPILRSFCVERYVKISTPNDELNKRLKLDGLRFSLPPGAKPYSSYIISEHAFGFILDDKYLTIQLDTPHNKTSISISYADYTNRLLKKMKHVAWDMLVNNRYIVDIPPNDTSATAITMSLFVSGALCVTQVVINDIANTRIVTIDINPIKVGTMNIRRQLDDIAKAIYGIYIATTPVIIENICDKTNRRVEQINGVINYRYNGEIYGSYRDVIDKNF